MGEARTRVALDVELLGEARAFGLDVSAIAESALRAAVKAEKARRWYEENAEAIAQRARRIEEHGMPLAEYAVWKP
jgi:antitoxin CcdA